MTVVWPAGAVELLDESRVARLATCDALNTPHVIPVCYARLRDRVYSVVDAKPKRNPLGLKRLRNIAENPRVALIVDRYDDDWSRLAWVLLHGRAVVVGDEREYGDALDQHAAEGQQVFKCRRNHVRRRLGRAGESLRIVALIRMDNAAELIAGIHD